MRRDLCLRPPPRWRAAPGRGGDPAEGAAGPPGPASRRDGARPRPAAARPLLTSHAGQSRRGNRSPAGPPPAPPGPPSGSLASGTPRRWGPSGGASGRPQEAGVWLVRSRAATRTPRGDWLGQGGARSRASALAAGRGWP